MGLLKEVAMDQNIIKETTFSLEEPRLVRSRDRRR